MIEEVREWYKAGLTQQVLALDFGVSQKCISNWVRKEKGKNNDFCNRIKRKK